MKNLINTLKTYSEISTTFDFFNYGENIELNLNGSATYPQLFLEEPLTITLNSEFFLTFDFAVLMLDYENTDKDYKKDTDKIQKFINEIPKIIDYFEENGYILESEVSAITLREFTSDLCCGLRVEFSVKYLKKC